MSAPDVGRRVINLYEALAPSVRSNRTLRRKRKRVPGSVRDLAKQRGWGRDKAHRYLVRKRGAEPTWYTPAAIMAPLHAIFGTFDLDPASPSKPVHVKCHRHYTIHD